MFSTPDKTYLGKSLGTASTDNVRKISESVVRGEMDGWVYSLTMLHTEVVK